MSLSAVRRVGPALLGECIGTFILVVAVGCNALAKSPPAWGMTAIGLTYAALVYALGSVSGGHLNPAVSVAAGLAGRFTEEGAFSSWAVALAYVLVQVIGAIGGAFAYCTLFDDNVAISPNKPFSWWEAMIVESLYTALLAFVHLSVTCTKRNNPEHGRNQFYGLAVGFALIAGGQSAGAVSGGVLNPALALAIEATSTSERWGFAYAAYHLVGAIIGALLFRLARPEERLGEAARLAYAPKLATRLVSEFIGTFAVVLTLGLNVAGLSAAAAWATGASLTSVTFALNDVSGGHFNPAVTLAAVLSRSCACSAGEGLTYMLFQVAAGCLGGLLYAGIYDIRTFALSPKDPYPDKSAYVLEFLFTFLLALAFLGTASRSRSHHFGLIVGLTLFAGMLATFPVSGGILNPAAAVGIAVPHSMNGGHMFYCASFSVVELFGGVMAALTFQITHVKELAPSKVDRALFATSEQ